MSEEQWMMRIEGALNAHFKQPDGSSRPGADWAVGLKHGNNIYKVIVRAYLSNDLRPDLKTNQQYQAQTVMGFLNDLIGQGWSPDQARDLVITITNPLQ